MGNDNCMSIFEDQNMDFFLEKKEICEKPEYKVVIKSKDESKILIDEIELINEKELSHFILIINQIYHHVNIPENDMNSFKDRVGSILNDKYLKDQTIDLNSLNDIRRNRFSFKNIQNCFQIFKVIYDKKKEIPSEKIDYLLCEIEFILKKTGILDDLNIKQLKNILEQIYKEGKNKTTEKELINNKQNINDNDSKINNTIQNADNTNPSNNPKKEPEKENGSGKSEEKNHKKDNELNPNDFARDPPS